MTDQHAYFRSLYQASDDPYGVGERWYEARKRAVLLAALPRQRYARAFEPACGVGPLTVALAPRCDSLLASDFCDEALAVARRRCAGLPQVQLARQRLPEDWPTQAEGFDLIVLSEMLYFLDAPALQGLLARLRTGLAPGGTLVACDWRPDFAQRSQSTAAVHAALDTLGLARLVRHEEDDFLLQVWSDDARSVAQQEGIR